jgi:hypothetical protein
MKNRLHLILRVFALAGARAWALIVPPQRAGCEGCHTTFGIREKGRPPCVGEQPLIDANIRHEQPVAHALLKVPDHMCLGSWDGDRQHVAVGGPELDDIRSIVLPVIGYDEPP